MLDLKPCQHQVAGHLFEQGKAGSLVDGHGHFYKPIQPGPRGDREKSFYTLMKERREKDNNDYIRKGKDPQIIESLSYIIEGGSFRKVVEDLGANQRSTLSDSESLCFGRSTSEASKRFLVERVPTFSRTKSIFSNEVHRSIEILEQDEFGLVDGVKLEPHDIIWSDEEDEHFSGDRGERQAHSIIDALNVPIVKDQERNERLLQLVMELPFILRNAPLLRTVPKFFRVHSCEGQTLLELEDVARNYDHPAIIDIKIGKKTWYDEAEEAYIQRCKVKDSATTQGRLGFKICGMQVFRHKIGGYWRASKKWCKTITENTIDRALESFVHNQNGLTPIDIFGGPEGVIHQLSLLEDWFSFQTEFRFFSSSILILYEGKASSSSDANVSLRMIDFAHTFHVPGGLQKDENYLEGLKSLKTRLLGILNRQT
jgi:hypothetical protein